MKWMFECLCHHPHMKNIVIIILSPAKGEQIRYFGSDQNIPKRYPTCSSYPTTTHHHAMLLPTINKPLGTHFLQLFGLSTMSPLNASQSPSMGKVESWWKLQRKDYTKKGQHKVKDMMLAAKQAGDCASMHHKHIMGY